MTAELTTDVSRAADCLRAGGLVAFATETVYGLGANALHPDAVARVFEAKGRPHFDPLIVHLADASEWDRLVLQIPPLARKLTERFWPGPLTIILPRQPIVPDLVTSGLPNVAVRVPAHPLARELIRLAGCPVAAPSANLFGRISPTTAAHVAEQLGDRIDLILDGGPCQVGVESTVLDLTSERPRLLRPGGITREEIEPLTGPLLTAATPVPDGTAAPAPGMLTQHYAPRIAVRIVESWEHVPPGDRCAALAFRALPYAERYVATEVLAPDGDLRVAAAGFFAALRRLDASGADSILVEPFPERGLGLALNDRLRRATASHPAQ